MPVHIYKYMLTDIGLKFEIVKDSINFKILTNTFRAMPFESLKISVARIRTLQV